MTNTAQDPAHYNWRALWQMLKRYKRQVLSANLLALLAGLAGIPTPLLIAALVNQVVLGKPGWLLDHVRVWLPEAWHQPIAYALVILLIGLAFRLINFMANLGQMRLFIRVGKSLSADLREWLFATLQRQPLEVFDRLGSGRVVNHFTSDVETIENFFGKAMSSFVYSLLLGSGVLVAMLWINWKLMLVMLAVNGLVLFIGKKFGKRVRQYRAKENRTYGDFQGSLTETLDALPELRATNNEQEFFARMRRLTTNLREASIGTTWISELISRISQLCMSVGFDVFRTTAILMVLFSGMELGDVFAVFAYLWILMGAMESITTAQHEYHHARAALQRLDDFALNRAGNIVPSSTSRSQAQSGQRGVDIEFDKVGFGYNPSRPVLQHICLDISAGEKIGLVGHSGSGKSTLIQLLLGLYTPQLGAIRIDGQQLAGDRLDAFRNQVALVMQFPALLNDSLANNLRLGQQYSEAQLWDALGKAQLADNVRAMPEQLETPIGRSGLKLSGGQRQRVALARVFLQSPRLIALDEATSALDTQTEARLLAELTKHMQGRTVIMIAHRLSTLKMVDRIVVLQQGQLIESGTHQQLHESDGAYSQLARLAEVYPESFEAMR